MGLTKIDTFLWARPFSEVDFFAMMFKDKNIQRLKCVSGCLEIGQALKLQSPKSSQCQKLSNKNLYKRH